MIDPRILQAAQAAQKANAISASLTRMQELYRRIGVWQPAPKAAPVQPRWSREVDPNVPAEFKQYCRELLWTEHQLLTLELTERSYDIDLCVICEYHKLAKTYYEEGLGEVPQLVLWKKVSAVHKRILDVKKDPTNRRRVLIRLGLGSLPGPPRGRSLNTSQK